MQNLQILLPAPQAPRDRRPGGEGVAGRFQAPRRAPAAAGGSAPSAWHSGESPSHSKSMIFSRGGCLSSKFLLPYTIPNPSKLYTIICNQSEVLNSSAGPPQNAAARAEQRERVHFPLVLHLLFPSSSCPHSVCPLDKVEIDQDTNRRNG